jgi:hypothetical protein
MDDVVLPSVNVQKLKKSLVLCGLLFRFAKQFAALLPQPLMVEDLCISKHGVVLIFRAIGVIVPKAFQNQAVEVILDNMKLPDKSLILELSLQGRLIINFLGVNGIKQ